jgi:hypothetical protein
MTHYCRKSLTSFTSDVGEYMFDDWPPACREIAERIRPMLCRHGAQLYRVDMRNEVRVGWPQKNGKKHDWLAILTWAASGSVVLKLRVGRTSGHIGSDRPLKPSPEAKRENAARDDGPVKLNAQLPANLPMLITSAFKFCLQKYKRPLDLKEREQPLPEEVTEPGELREGAVKIIAVNAYERNAEARRQCIAAHQPRCCICGFDFGAAYGPEFDGFIHVHHLRPLSEIGGEYEVNPIEDLRPVCPNCHAVVHFGGRNRSIEEVKELLRRAGR